MIYLNRFIDEEDNTTDYETFILTKVDCSDLIQSCLDAFYDMRGFENESVKELLRSKTIQDKRIINFLKEHKDDTADDFGNAYYFTDDVLQYNNYLIDSEYETQEFYY